ncbi:MAG: AraC family transcriptional regulator [Desulfovibrionaceae bacterium]
MDDVDDPRRTRRLVLLDFPALPGVRGVRALGMAHEFERHVHESWCVGRMDAGGRLLELDGHTRIAPTGSVFVIPPGRPHACRPAPGPEPAYRVACLSPAALADVLAQIGPGPATLPAGVHHNPAAADALHALFQAHQGDPLDQQECLLRLAAALAAPPADPQDPEPAPPPGADPAVARATTYLHDHLTDPVSLADLARHTGLGPWTLHRRFRRQTGITPHEYLVTLRVKHAAERLRHGAPPAEAAADAGFCDQSHLNRHFKRLTGLPPATFARQQGEDESG